VRIMENDTNTNTNIELNKDNVIFETLGVELAITPSDICSQDFKRAIMGGYDPDHVDDFLERTANAMDHLMRRVYGLKEKNDELTASIAEYREIEDSLRKTLLDTQKLNEDLLESAKREAKIIVDEAHLEKSRIEMEITSMPEKISQEMSALEQQRDRLRMEILAVLETHKSLIKVMIPEIKPRESIESAGLPVKDDEGPGVDGPIVIPAAPIEEESAVVTGFGEPQNDKEEETVPCDSGISDETDEESAALEPKPADEDSSCGAESIT